MVLVISVVNIALHLLICDGKVTQKEKFRLRFSYSKTKAIIRARVISTYPEFVNIIKIANEIIKNCSNQYMYTRILNLTKNSQPPLTGYKYYE